MFTQVEELDERMQKLTHKLENARRDFVRAASEAYAVDARRRDVNPARTRLADSRAPRASGL